MRLLQVYREVFFPYCLEKYWEDLFKQREAEDSWQLVNVFGDIFQPCIDEETKNENGKVTGGSMTFVCVIPKPHWFWDIILSMYLTVRPDIFQSQQMIVKQIHDLITRFKVNPKRFKNFDGCHLEYLENLRDGTRQLLTHHKPGEMAACVRVAQFLLPMLPDNSGGDPEIMQQLVEKDANIAREAFNLEETTMQHVAALMRGETYTYPEREPRPRPQALTRDERRVESTTKELSDLSI